MSIFDFVSYKNQLEACKQTWGLVPHPAFERLEAPSGLPMTTPWSVCAVGRKAEPEPAKSFYSLASTETPVSPRARVSFPEFDTQPPTRSIARAVDTIETDREERRRAEEEARCRAEPRVEISDIWTDHSVECDGRDGMLIHTAFTSANLQDRNLQAIAFFYYDGTQKPVASALKEFSTSEGGLCVAEDFSPRYQRAKFSGFWLFLPLDAFRIKSKGTWRLKFEVVIRRAEPTWAVLTRSPWQYFDYSVTASLY